MSLPPDCQPLPIRPRLSRQLLLYVAVTHLVAFASLLALPLGIYRVWLLLSIALSGGHALIVQVLRLAPWSIRSALWQADGVWLLTLRSGAEVAAELSPATFVSLPLVALNFRVGRWRRYALPLFADALAPDVLRQLRQRLRQAGADADSALENR